MRELNINIPGNEVKMIKDRKYFQKYLGAILSFLLCLFSYANAGDLLVTWDPNNESDLAGYTIYYGTSSRQYSNDIDVGSMTSHQVQNLTDGIEYFFAVTAYDTAGNESAYSDEVSAIPGGADTTPPVSPHITGHAIQGNKIVINWSENSESDLAGYKVYYGTSSRTYTEELNAGKSTSYTTPDLVPGVKYFFAITAYDTNNNESNYSTEYSITIPIVDTTPPSAPLISDYQRQQNKVHIIWQANNEPDISGYRVYYGKASKVYDDIADVGMATNYVSPDFEPGITYFFAVTAYDTANNESDYSIEVNITLPPIDVEPPPSPVISNLELEERKVHLYWGGVSEPDLGGYRVYYGTSTANYDVVENVGNLNEYITTDLSEGIRYYFAVTAYDTLNNESDFSNEMSIEISVIDITSPTIYAVEIRDSNLVNLVFSEPVEKATAEDVSNYYIDHNIHILQVSLDGNQRMVHITTNSHQSGIIYTLTANNVTDLAENPNMIKPNSTCNYQFNPEDFTPPFITNVEIMDATHINVTFSEDIERQSAEIAQNYSINNGITVLDAELDNNLRIVQLTTAAHQNRTTYTLTINDVKDRAPIPNSIAQNSSKQYTYYEEDTTPPAIYSTEIRAENAVNVIFSENLEQESAENKENYVISNGVVVLDAKLDNNLHTVNLTTTAHQVGLTYIITVDNVKDLAYPSNKIAPNSMYTYTYTPQDTVPPTIILVDCIDGNHVDVTYSESVERESAENEGNYLINNGISIIEATLDNNQRVVHLITTAHQSGQTYILTVNNVKDRAPVPNVIQEENSSGAYTFFIEDTTPPTITDVIAVNSNSVEIIFSEIVNRGTAEIIENYHIDNGVIVLAVRLYEDLKTVMLSTTEHEPDKFYVLTVNNIKDRAYPPNTIESNSNYNYQYVSGTESEGPIVGNFNHNNYEAAYLHEGNFYYVDRSYIIKSIPNKFQGLLWIKTSNDDRSNNIENFLTFDLHKDSKVYVAYDSRALSVPNWLKNNFHPINEYIGVSEYAERLELWEKDCTKGNLTFGGNLAEGSQSVESMYIILIKANGDQPPGPIDTSDPKSLGPADIFSLHQNYPNPFNSGTEIRYQLPENCYVSLTVYNILGQTVKKLVQGHKEASHHLIHWNGRNRDGNSVPSGVYFSRLEIIRETQVNNKKINQVVFNEVKKMIYLK